MSLLATFLIVTTLLCICVGFGCGYLMPGITIQQGLRRSIVVGLVIFALSMGLFFIQGDSLIYVAIALGMCTTGGLCLWSSSNGSTP